MWIFGYGSLVWRPAFPHRSRQPALLRGWVRRFWQGSTDHRGTPEAPGRVVTLLSEPAGRCWGMAYELAPDQVEQVLPALDHRERGGYERHVESIELRDGGRRQALLYVATPDNPEFLGDAPLEAIAAQIRRSHGPSGPNVEYVLELDRALRAMGADDAHVAALAALLR